MPTGYTAPLAEQPMTFRDFALRCARAFGALVHMRDSGLDAPLPDIIQPSAWHAEKALEARRGLAEVEAMTEEQAQRAADAEHEETLSRYRSARIKDAATAERYGAMLALVEAWKLPTSDHEGLKRFMVEQLTESIRFDLGVDWSDPPRKTGPEWRAERIAKFQRDIAYHTDEQAKEEQRAAERTRWLSALRQSLPG